MFRFSVLVFLAVMLCLPAGLCQTAADATEDQATKAVTEVKRLTSAALGKAENLLKRAKYVEKIVKAEKDKADRAASAVAVAATAAGNDNAKASAIAQKTKDEMVQCETLNNDAKAKAESATKHMQELITRANKLVQDADIEIPTATEQSTTYTEVVEKTKTITAETEKLTTDISSASTVWRTAVDALVKLKGGARKVQIIKYQADYIFNLAKIQSLLKEAKACIGDIEKKKDGIDATVQAMKNILGSAPALSTTLKPLCDEAESELRTASNNLNDAKTCNESMFWQEAQVEKDIATLNVETYEYKAKKQAYTVEWHTNYTEGMLKKMKEALQSAETSFSSVNRLHQQMLETMPQTKSRLGSDLNTENTNVDVPTSGVTTPIQSGEAAQPKPPNTDKPEITETDKPEITNSELLNNGNLHMMSKNITKEPLDSEKVLSAPGAKNDSAMTVSIPLLAALIVSAVLH